MRTASQPLRLPWLGRKTLFWFFLLFCLSNIILLVIFIKQNKKEKPHLPHEATTGALTIATSCSSNLTIHPENYLIKIMNGTSCHPHVPPESACRFTKNFFKLVPNIEKCKDQEHDPYELCQLQEKKSSTSSFTKLRFKCDLSVCDWSKGIFIEWLDATTGRMTKYQVPLTVPNNTHVEGLVLKTAKNVRKDGFPFLFLNCTSLENKKVVAQLLTLLPSLPWPTEKSWSEKININLVLIDSVSRAHFYRSLPKTVDYLQSIQDDPDFNAHVFDYELFQSVHGHTEECERALFDGELFPGNVSGKIRDKTPIHLDVLYSIIKQAGYQTLFLDDLCWLGYYGLVSKYKTSGWKALQEKLQKSSIDSLGFTDASCAILHRLNMNCGFFNTPNHQICFNGKHQHQYLFEYLTRYLDAIREAPRSKPLFSYTSTHVSHDSRGLRVQSIDTDLKNFMSAMATKENTISIIFADHGNTYTYYQVAEHEGRREMYHPAMMVVLPKTVAKKLGENVVSNLRTNQYRLFNLFDVREGLIELVTYDGKTTMNPKGIFGPISKKRTCDDLAMTASSICLCEDWEVSVANSTEQMALAEFAIGQLNNKIQEDLLNSLKKGKLLDSRKGSSNARIGTRIVFGACQRLRAQEIGNVRTRRTREGIRTTTMDVRVQTGNVMNQRELITTQVSFHEKATVSSAMQLMSYNRISSYGSYKVCGDPGVDLKLCVCDKPGTEATHQSLHDVVGKDAIVTKLNSCVHGVHRSHSNKIMIVDVYEVANICDAQSFSATLEATGKSITFSTQLPYTVTLAPRTIYFVALSKALVKDYPTRSPIHWRVELEETTTAKKTTKL